MTKEPAGGKKKKMDDPFPFNILPGLFLYLSLFACFLFCFVVVAFVPLQCIVRITFSPDWEMNQWVVWRTSAACKLLWYLLPSLWEVFIFISTILYFLYFQISSFVYLYIYNFFHIQVPSLCKSFLSWTARIHYSSSYYY